MDAFPPSPRHATLAEFKYALLELSSSGVVKLCDATGGDDVDGDSCAQSPRKLTTDGYD